MPLASPSPVSFSATRAPLGWLAIGALGLTLVASSVSASQEAAPGAVSDSLLVPQFETTFGAGDAEELLRAAATRVELSLFGRASYYSRTQALYVMRDFFRRYPPESVSFRDQSVGVGTRTLLGTYEERGGGHYRVAVQLRHRTGVWEVVAVQMDRAASDVADAQ